VISCSEVNPDFDQAVNLFSRVLLLVRVCYGFGVAAVWRLAGGLSLDQQNATLRRHAHCFNPFSPTDNWDVAELRAGALIGEREGVSHHAQHLTDERGLTAQVQRSPNPFYQGRDGLRRLTTIRVAARAGTSVGTLYQYYPNKQALLFAVLQRRSAEAFPRLSVTSWQRKNSGL